MACTHETFGASMDVFRLTANEGGPVTHYNAEIRIFCTACGVRFMPQGLPVGCSPYHPATDLEGSLLNLPIMPPGEKAPSGLPGYAIKIGAPT